MQLHQQLMPLIARLLFQIQIIESVIEMEAGVSWDVAAVQWMEGMCLYCI